MTPRFLDPAEQELAEAAEFFEERGTGLGAKFLNEVEGCVELLLEFPQAGRKLGKFKRFPLRNFLLR
ncbi:MAG: type II toxin-antitoxin system RelE/ParE family toxin [Gammaproteobacteria bacterium]